VGRLAHALPPRRTAQHSEADRNSTSSGGPAADVTPSAANGAAVEPLRALRCITDFSGPGAPGLAGDRGDDLTGAAPSGATRSDLQAGQFVKRAFVHVPVKETRPAIPGHGNGPLSSSPPAPPV
jgi:hypothetical protein